MNEDNFNMEIRKFLKQVGVTSQHEIEQVKAKYIRGGPFESPFWIVIGGCAFYAVLIMAHPYLSGIKLI